jgi:DNA-binding YbaB/EbfC family protein
MKGFGNLVKEAQKLQAQLEALKEEVGKRKVEASAGGGMVVVEANGSQEILSIKIDREVITPDDAQMLEDLVLAAVNEALRKARVVASEMSKIGQRQDPAHARPPRLPARRSAGSSRRCNVCGIAEASQAHHHLPSTRRTGKDSPTPSPRRRRGS